MLKSVFFYVSFLACLLQYQWHLVVNSLNWKEVEYNNRNLSARLKQQDSGFSHVIFLLDISTCAMIKKKLWYEDEDTET